MKEAFWGYWLIILGIFVITVLLLIQNLTSQNTHDYYAVKEITEAAMKDAIDVAYYEEYGEVRIKKEKFIESFLERFSESASLSNTYKVTFYDIYEVPPKVSLKVSSTSASFNVVGDTSTFDIVNTMDMLLETDPALVTSDGKLTAKCIDCIKVVVTTGPGSKKVIPGYEVSGLDGYSQYTIISDETDPEGCQTITAAFKSTDSSIQIGYKSFVCRNYDNKSPGCNVVFPSITKINGSVCGWVAENNPGGTVYLPGSTATITSSTTFIPKTTGVRGSC